MNDQYKNRFYCLLESERGNVRPIIGEQIILGGAAIWGGKPHMMAHDLANIRDKFPAITDTIVQLGLWQIPLAGSFLAAGYGSMMAYRDLKNGKYVEGIIGLITSPLSLQRTIIAMSFLQVRPQLINVLKKIHKSGTAILTSQGKAAFLKWASDNFVSKDDLENFNKFMTFLTKGDHLKSLLNLINDDVNKEAAAKQNKMIVKNNVLDKPQNTASSTFVKKPQNIPKL